MRNYPYIVLTLILAVVLAGPFILKLKDSRLEIFPAVIFPSGAAVVETKRKFLTSYKYEIYGCKNTVLKEIAKKDFLGDIPVWYFHTIHQGYFGLEHYSEKFKLYKPPIQFELNNTFTPESVSETKTWLRRRLKEIGLEDSTFILREYMLIYNVRLKKMESKQIVSEKVYDLY